MKEFALLAALEGINSITYFCLYPRKELKDIMMELSQRTDYKAIFADAQDRIKAIPNCSNVQKVEICERVLEGLPEPLYTDTPVKKMKPEPEIAPELDDDIFESDEEVNAPTTKPLTTPLKFLDNIAVSKPQADKKTTFTKVNKTFKLKLLKEVHKRQNVHEVADEYGVSKEKLDNWYKSYMTGKPLTDSLVKVNPASAAIEKAFADIETKDEDEQLQTIIKMDQKLPNLKKIKHEVRVVHRSKIQHQANKISGYIKAYDQTPSRRSIQQSPYMSRIASQKHVGFRNRISPSRLLVPEFLPNISPSTIQTDDQMRSSTVLRSSRSMLRYSATTDALLKNNFKLISCDDLRLYTTQEQLQTQTRDSQMEQDDPDSLGYRIQVAKSDKVEMSRDLSTYEFNASQNCRFNQILEFLEEKSKYFDNQLRFEVECMRKERQWRTKARLELNLVIQDEIEYLNTEYPAEFPYCEEKFGLKKPEAWMRPKFVYKK